MIIKKILSNNAVIVYDKGNEIILTGKGIGWQKKPGEEIDESKVEKRFHLSEGSDHPY